MRPHIIFFPNFALMEMFFKLNLSTSFGQRIDVNFGCCARFTRGSATASLCGATMGYQYLSPTDYLKVLRSFSDGFATQPHS